MSVYAIVTCAIFAQLMQKALLTFCCIFFFFVQNVPFISTSRIRQHALCRPINRLSREHHIIQSLSVTFPQRPTVNCPFWSRMAAHGAEGTALCPSAWLQRCTSLLAQEREHKRNTKRHAVRSESKQCWDCNLFLGRKQGCCVFKRGCWSLIAAAGVCVCVCDIEDSGDSLLKQYNGHLSPRGVIQIQYQARTFSTPLSALRRGSSVYCWRSVKKTQEGRETCIQSVSQSV